MGRLRVQSKTESSTREEFISRDMYMLLDENDTVHIDHTTTRNDKINTL